MEKSEDDMNIIKLDFENPEIESIHTSFKESASVRGDQKIGEYVMKSGKRFPIVAPFYGKIRKIDTVDKVIVIERCKHESFYLNFCVECNYDKRTNPGGNTGKKYCSLHSMISFSEEKAKEEEMNLVSKYLTAKKLILLLDLDNTVLHASPIEITKDEYIQLKEKYNDEIACLGVKDPLHPHIRKKIVFKLRPYLQSLLEDLQDKYDIYTYTHGTKDYASEIISYVNRIYNGNFLSVDKLIARENNVVEIKTIKKVFPTTEDMVVILDDRSDVWMENPQNLILVQPYAFFNDERLLRINEKFAARDEDNALYSIRKFLHFVHSAFYYKFQENRTRLDVKKIIDTKIKSVLRGVNVICSGIFMKDENIKDSWVNSQIERLGGGLVNDYSEDVSYVLTGEYKRTPKVIKATKDKKKILHISWLDLCAMYYFRLAEDEFVLCKTSPVLTGINCTEILNKNQAAIDEFYSIEEEKIKLFCELLDQ